MLVAVSLLLGLSGKSVQSPARIVDVFGYKWGAKHGDRMGPGPNYWSNSFTNIFIDKRGLHLSIQMHNNTWTCPEITAETSLGYGTYTYQIDRSSTEFDPNAVFSGFIYESDDKEIDIEFSRGLVAPKNTQFVIQPYTTEGNIEKFDLEFSGVSSHRIEWRAKEITFTSWRGTDPNPSPSTTLKTWTYRGPNNPKPGLERFHFNFWLFGGKPPINGKSQEIVVRSFVFMP